MQIEKKVIIATHVLSYGAPHALCEYLAKKQYDILFIGLPFHDQNNVIIEKYIVGKLVKKTGQERKIQGIRGYIFDLYTILRVVLSSKEKFDVFVGVNNLNCFAGLILKKIGKVKRVIYYAIDFVPIRFSNKIINEIYHQIEVFCVLRADEVWNVSPRIAEGRKKFLGINPIKRNQKVVPIGIWKKAMRIGKDAKKA